MRDAKTNRLIRMLKDELENGVEYLAETAYAKNTEYVKVLEASLEDLGLMVNETGLTGDMVTARLRGEDIRTPECTSRLYQTRHSIPVSTKRSEIMMVRYV